MAKLNTGDLAPDFTLPSTEKSENFTLSSAKGSWIVLYFYPKDDTPGCTKEACNFRDRVKDYQKVNAKIYGISTDSLASHQKFIAKFNLPFPLLADVDKKVVELYDVYKEKSMYGKKYLGIVRSTFIVDPEGKISKIFSNVKVDEHHQEVLDWIAANS